MSSKHVNGMCLDYLNKVFDIATITSINPLSFCPTKWSNALKQLLVCV